MSGRTLIFKFSIRRSHICCPFALPNLKKKRNWLSFSKPRPVAPVWFQIVRERIHEIEYLSSNLNQPIFKVSENLRHTAFCKSIKYLQKFLPKHKEKPTYSSYYLKFKKQETGFRVLLPDPASLDLTIATQKKSIKSVTVIFHIH